MRTTRDYGQSCVTYGGTSNIYFIRDAVTLKYIDDVLRLLRTRPMSIYELSDELDLPKKRLEHIIDTATLIYGNVWEENRRVPIRGQMKEVTYYAAE